MYQLKQIEEDKNEKIYRFQIKGKTFSRENKQFI